MCYTFQCEVCIRKVNFYNSFCRSVHKEYFGLPSDTFLMSVRCPNCSKDRKVKVIGTPKYGMNLNFRISENECNLKNLSLRQLTGTILNKSKVRYFEDGFLNTIASRSGHLRVTNLFHCPLPQWLNKHVETNNMRIILKLLRGEVSIVRNEFNRTLTWYSPEDIEDPWNSTWTEKGLWSDTILY